MADSGEEKGAKPQLNPLASGLGSGGDIGDQLKGIPVATVGKEKLGWSPTDLVYTKAVSTNRLVSRRGHATHHSWGHSGRHRVHGLYWDVVRVQILALVTLGTVTQCIISAQFCYKSGSQDAELGNNNVRLDALLYLPDAIDKIQYE